ncbi:MAG: molybdopterin molybdenumtransferase MoeA, partial [Chloroflexi bacterium]|nr:molybdopterin molybdenumtransferase MoeA [Chloroflexota bacterium]
MPEFLTLIPPQEALGKLIDHLEVAIKPEIIAAAKSLHRVTAESIRAPHPLPEFARSTVDGYALRAADTYGAAESLPAYLPVVGEVPMGAAPTFS